MWTAVCLAAAAPSECSEARADTWIRPSVGPPKGTDLERSARDSDVTGSVTLREQAAVQCERDIGLERWHRAGTVPFGSFLRQVGPADGGAVICRRVYESEARGELSQRRRSWWVGSPPSPQGARSCSQVNIGEILHAHAFKQTPNHQRFGLSMRVIFTPIIDSDWETSN